MINILIKKAQMGCKSSRNLIIEKNLSITQKIASRYKGVYPDLDELEQEGVMGIIQAIEAYDDSQDCSFETYATRRVFTVVDEYVLKNKHIQTIPLYILKKLRSMKNRVETNADKRHHDENLCLSDFDGERVTLKSNDEELDSGGISEDFISTLLSTPQLEDSVTHAELDKVKKKLCEHEGGRFLVSNLLLGDSIKNIASDYATEPYYVNKMIKNCLDSMEFS